MTRRLAKLGGLAPATTYHYRVVARSVAGVSIGRDRRFTTLGRPCCEAPQAQPPTPPPSGPGDLGPAPSEPPKAQLTVGRITGKRIASWVRSGRLRLNVTVGGGGEVSARARAQLPGHWEPSTVARDSTTAAAPGVVTLTLELSRAARRALADFRLPVTIVVGSTGADRAHTLRVTLKRGRARAAPG